MSYITLPRQKVIDACSKVLDEIKEERTKRMEKWLQHYDKQITKCQNGFFGFFKISREEAIANVASLWGDGGFDYDRAAYYRHDDLLTANKLFKLAEACYDDEKLFINDEHILVISKYLEK